MTAGSRQRLFMKELCQNLDLTYHLAKQHDVIRYQIGTMYCDHALILGIWTSNNVLWANHLWIYRSYRVE